MLKSAARRSDMAHDQDRKMRRLGVIILIGIAIIIAMNVGYYWYDVYATNIRIIEYQKERAAG
jgi:hypothetical protein